jgi:hypothetical protein
MSLPQKFFEQWYFHVPDRLLVLLMVLIGVHFLFDLAIATFRREDIGAMRFLSAMTASVVVPVRFLTPRIVPDAVVMIFAIAWLQSLRLVLFAVCSALGLRPVL